MSKTINLAVAVFVAIMAIGCNQPTDPVPDPVKVYLTGSETFTRVDEAGTLDYADIYQWDGAGTYYTGDDVAVTFDATYDTEWTITVGGNTYLNDANIGVTYYHDPVDASLDFEFVVQSGVVGNNIGSGFEPFETMNPTYTGSNTIIVDDTATGGSLHTWTR
jgi:hypothetical protein